HSCDLVSTDYLLSAVTVDVTDQDVIPVYGHRPVAKLFVHIAGSVKASCLPITGDWVLANDANVSEIWGGGRTRACWSSADQPIFEHFKLKPVLLARRATRLGLLSVPNGPIKQPIKNVAEGSHANSLGHAVGAGEGTWANWPTQET